MVVVPQLEVYGYFQFVKAYFAGFGARRRREVHTYFVGHGCCGLVGD